MTDPHLARLAELGTMSAAMVHELRQPLFAARGFAQLLEARGGEGAELAGQIRAQLDQLEELVRVYGSFSERAAPPAPFAIGDTVQRAVGVLRGAARRAGIALSAQVIDDALVVGRAGAVRQIVVNLVRNALDAAGHGQGSQVVVELAVHADAVCLAVDDDGPGFAPDVVGRAFEPFVTTKSGDRGTGLGLYLVGQLVEELGGSARLAVSSRGGARVEVSLPRAPDQASPGSVDSVASEASSSAPSSAADRPPWPAAPRKKA